MSNETLKVKNFSYPKLSDLLKSVSDFARECEDTHGKAYVTDISIQCGEDTWWSANVYHYTED